ncbi:MAG: TetR/AcrR family transcriptional regulator [Gammaproteobacteria bacterium]|nr:TetR/AcrR family transcriptional regulator [Gammaproteobacteria bacterium]
MDKREIKTQNKLFNAFNELVSCKKYEDIIVEDILNLSNVSRSTFYKHFKDKDDLLLLYINYTFKHIFDPNLEKENNHDFSSSYELDKAHYIRHMLCHFDEDRLFFKGILESSGKEIFTKEFRKNLLNTFENFSSNNFLVDDKIPHDLSVNMITDEFMGLVIYWITSDNEYTSEDIMHYFIKHNTYITLNNIKIEKQK